MGFFKRFKKLVKIAAPIAASFVPGGSTAMNVISKAQKFRGVVSKIQTARSIGSDLRNNLRGQGVTQRLTGRRRGVNPSASALTQGSVRLTNRGRGTPRRHTPGPAFRVRRHGVIGGPVLRLKVPKGRHRVTRRSRPTTQRRVVRRAKGRRMPPRNRHGRFQRRAA